MTCSVFVGASLDGFIARLDGSYDFLTAGGEADGAANGYDAFFATVDAVLMGRATYEVVLPFPAWPYGRAPVFVLSHSELRPAPAGAVVERIEGEPVSVHGELSRRGFRHLYVDGGRTIQSFLKRGLIDRLVVTRVPVLVGTGIPLFGPLDADVALRHVATRVIAGRAVQSEYAVIRP